MAFTAKQQRFIDEFVIDFNASEAAIRAGYSKKTARSIASELLTKPDIKEAIEKKKAKLTAKTELTAQWIIDNLIENHSKAIKLNKISDANKSLELLGKYLGIFHENLKISGGMKNEVEITIGVEEYET